MLSGSGGRANDTSRRDVMGLDEGLSLYGLEKYRHPDKYDVFSATADADPDSDGSTTTVPKRRLKSAAIDAICALVLGEAVREYWFNLDKIQARDVWQKYIDVSDPDGSYDIHMPESELSGARLFNHIAASTRIRLRSVVA